MNKIISCDLQMFTEGANGAAGADVAAGSAAAQTAETSQVAADTGANEGSNADDRAARFRELITGEYAEEYNKHFNSQMSKRLKISNKTIAEQAAFRTKIEPLLQRLGTKYSEDPNNIEAILKAAEKDNSFYEAYAAAHGVDIEAAKVLAEAEMIKAQDKARRESETERAEFQKRYNGWLDQAEALQEYYPSFDFDYESTNEETGELFRTLLNAGCTVRNAYESVHVSELMGGAMNYAYQTARQEAADARTSRMNRPTENGTSSQQASAFKDDMTKLSPEQRKLIKAAVDRGEKVSPENFTKFL